MNKFESDYMLLGHKEVLDAVYSSKDVRFSGYGQDNDSNKVREIILKECGVSKGYSVHFFVGGTLANRVLLDNILEVNQAVIAADQSHIFTHESGAIEALGHKVITLESQNGKISSDSVDEYLCIYENSMNKIHMAEPGAVYITQPTELGTLYSKKELKDISDVCKKHNILLYIDGARLAYALGSKYNDVSLKDVAKFADCFYIGGAKCGAIFGEAGVIAPSIREKNFLSCIKRHGALFAKGRIISLQFQVLFKDNLYTRIGRIADEMAEKIYDSLSSFGYKFIAPVQTNQIFIILSSRQIDNFKKNGFDIGIWEKIGDENICRIITDWSFSDSEIDEFIDIARKVK